MFNKNCITTSATAPAKYIIIGEHAVIYGKPAIAAPLNSISSIATITPTESNNYDGLYIDAPDINLSNTLDSIPKTNPIAHVIRQTLRAINHRDPIPANLTITSTIPIASGLGSSASVSTAISRCIINYLGHTLTNDQISNIVYKTESLQHGNPSGIDNTVIARGVPILYSKSGPIQYLRPNKPLYYVLADTLQPRSTLDTISTFKKQSNIHPKLFKENIRANGNLAKYASVAFQAGDNISLGDLMTKNHVLLQRLGVSTQKLDNLVDIATASGANGAKLSGAGHGGHIIAQVSKRTMPIVVKALKDLGANPLTTVIAP